MQHINLIIVFLLTLQLSYSQDSGGLAPEITDLNAADISFAAEKNIPDLEGPYISTSPADLGDGITVGSLGDRPEILTFAKQIAAGEHGEIDSFLLWHDAELVFESYFRRGRINYPHYQMSITKPYTAMAIGCAIQNGHLTMDDLDKPVVGFLGDLDLAKLAPGVENITLAQAMNMKSGIRLPPEKIATLRKHPTALKGQGQIQAYLQHTTPIPDAPRPFKYQASDPSIAMHVLETAVPGTARDFIKTGLLGRMGITNFAWQNDTSGLPKAAAGSSMRSRDMLKWGILTANNGKWNGQQLVPEAFVDRSTAKIHTNAQGTSYGFFWWRHDMKLGDRKFDCISGRGAGGQFIFIINQLDLIAVITAHNKGMGKILKTFPRQILPTFAR